MSSWWRGVGSTMALSSDPNFVLPILLLLSLLRPKLHPFWENQWCCTSMRNLIKDAPLSDSVRENEKEKRREEIPAPSGIRTHELLILRRVLYPCATTAPLSNDPNLFYVLNTLYFRLGRLRHHDRRPPTSEGPRSRRPRRWSRRWRRGTRTSGRPRTKPHLLPEKENNFLSSRYIFYGGFFLF